MTVLLLSGSFRPASLNTALAQRAAEVACSLGHEAIVVSDLYRLPFYDQQLERTAVPADVVALREQVAAADALVIVTPEYNGSVPGVLANAIDWLSRPHGGSTLRGKSVLVLSASPGEGGGARGAAHLRGVLSTIGAVPVAGPQVRRAHLRLGQSVSQVEQDLADDLRPAMTSLLSPGGLVAA